MQRVRKIARNFAERTYDAIDRIVSKINQGSSARRGIGTTGAKVNKSLYRCGGKKK